MTEQIEFPSAAQRCTTERQPSSICDREVSHFYNNIFMTCSTVKLYLAEGAGITHFSQTLRRFSFVSMVEHKRKASRQEYREAIRHQPESLSFIHDVPNGKVNFCGVEKHRQHPEPRWPQIALRVTGILGGIEWSTFLRKQLIVLARSNFQSRSQLESYF